MKAMDFITLGLLGIGAYYLITKASGSEETTSSTTPSSLSDAAGFQTATTAAEAAKDNATTRNEAFNKVVYSGTIPGTSIPASSGYMAKVAQAMKETGVTSTAALNAVATGNTWISKDTSKSYYGKRVYTNSSGKIVPV